MDNQKKISAAIAAVMHYIQEEEAILMQQAAMGGMPQAAICFCSGRGLLALEHEW